MTSPTTVSLISVIPSDLDRVEKLWHHLYEHQQQQGLIADLASDGFAKWRATLSRVLGRFACVFLAERDGELLGFIAGRVRTPTPPFSQHPVGFISEVFVADSARGQGVGGALIQQAIKWFEEQQITRIELQVLAGNQEARELYERAGWRAELLQMVWQSPPQHGREGL